jgi:hypothetical protein
LVDIFSFWEVDDAMELAKLPCGWFGKSTANMPSKITIQYDQEGTVVTTYRYETDSDGYITEVFTQINGEDEQLTLAISYQ